MSVGVGGHQPDPVQPPIGGDGAEEPRDVLAAQVPQGLRRHVQDGVLTQQGGQPPNVVPLPGQQEATQDVLLLGGLAATTFPNDEGYDELVLARGDPATSHLCAPPAPVRRRRPRRQPARRPHPRAVQARPAGRARRGTTPGAGTAHQQIADWLHRELDAKGVGVVLDAEHTCMTLRGVQAVGARTVTSALRGPAMRQPLLASGVRRTDRRPH